VQIERYARINPPARARALLWQGCAEWLRGRPKAANAAWRRCLLEAERFALPYEIARVHFEIGRRLTAADPLRHDHLMEAQRGFRHLKADAEIRRVAAALQIGASATAPLT
jgi:hypothetical protein